MKRRNDILDNIDTENSKKQRTEQENSDSSAILFSRPALNCSHANRKPKDKKEAEVLAPLMQNESKQNEDVLALVPEIQGFGQAPAPDANAEELRRRFLNVELAKFQKRLYQQSLKFGPHNAELRARVGTAKLRAELTGTQAPVDRTKRSLNFN